MDVLRHQHYFSKLSNQVSQRVAHLRAAAFELTVTPHGDCEYCPGGSRHEALTGSLRRLREHQPVETNRARKPRVQPGGLAVLRSTRAPASTGCGTGMATGGEDPLERNIPAKASATLYQPDLFLGNHEFKAGMDYVHSLISRRRAARTVEGDYQLNFRSGVPFQIVTYNFPVDPITSSDYLGLYLMDSWTIARRLTLNLGLRFARDQGYVPEQCREAGSFAPAFSVSAYCVSNCESAST